MALINCPECGREISDKAGSCPHCGFPINNNENVGIGKEESTISDLQKTDLPPVEVKNNLDGSTQITSMKNTWFSIASLILVILGTLLRIAPLIWGGFILGVIDFFINRDNRKYLFLILTFIIGVIGFLVCSISSFNSTTANKNSEEISKESESIIEEPSTEEISIVETDTVPIFDTVPTEIVFCIDLIDNRNDYIGKRVTTTLPIGECDEEEKKLTSTYDIGEFIDIYPANYQLINSGDFVTVTGIVRGDEYDLEIDDAHIDAFGESEENKFNEQKMEYDNIQMEKAIADESVFKETAESVSYENLARYPDSYENKKVKITVKIREVQKKDSMFFADSYIASMSGEEIAIYDERELKEPKLLEGDTVVIYGYGKGLTEIKTYDSSGIIPKVLDKRKIPAVSIAYIEIQ